MLKCLFSGPNNMLSSLRIENFALIDKIQIQFSPHLNVLTGETGAGKSILIDAIRFVLGERIERLGGSEPCLVEAVFEIEKKKLRSYPALEPFLGEDDELLILRKETGKDGRARALVNNRSVNNSTLKEIGDFLLDIHGQYDHQLLLNPVSHLELIDRFAKNENLKAEYQTIFDQYHDFCKRRDELKSLEEGRARQMDLLEYQIKEIEDAELVVDEEESLKTEQIRLANAEKLNELAARALGFLEEDDVSASGLIAKAFRDLANLAKLDPSLESAKIDYENTQLQFEEVIRLLRDYKENLSFDQDRFSEIEKRLDVLELLKRKYGASSAEILKFLEEIQKKYDDLSNSALYEKEADEQIKKILPKLSKLAGELTEKRKKAAGLVKRMIETELKDLGISHACFECRIEKQDFSREGQDNLEFMMSLNAGEPVLPMRKIVSAGEVSRVMLAIKKALSEVDPVHTLIFDEIDANIGGRLGTVTGKKLKEIAAARQVLLITHLPQIASFADRHFKVRKAVRGGKTYAEYYEIEGDERVKELSQMMAGKGETEISRKHAEEMLDKVSR